jgi:hypothetical protein
MLGVKQTATVKPLQNTPFHLFIYTRTQQILGIAMQWWLNVHHGT